MTAPAAAAPAAAAVPSPPATPAAAVAPPPMPAPPATPAAVSPPPPRPAEPQPVAEPAPWPESRKVQEKTTAAPKRIEIPVEQVAAAPSPQPVYTREQLPENIRAELPQFAVGGSIYSNNAAERSVIINGRIYRENDRLTADLTLEEIRLRGAVLRYKGYRFEVGF
jgi:general secretion pathway protein B